MKPATKTICVRVVCVAALCLTMCGCTSTRPIRGGKAVTAHKPAGGIEQTLVQGENPSAPTRQDQETIRIRSYTLPAGTRIEQPSGRTGRDRTNNRGGDGNATMLESSNAATTIILSAPTPVVEREETRANTELGAAQKDTARELGAKLSSLKGIVWVGVALFIFGVGSFAWPPLRAIIGSATTSAAITLGGIALMILPTLIVGNELLIFGGVMLAVGAWFLAHRHGHLRGQIAAAQRPVPKPKAAATATK